MEKFISRIQQINKGELDEREFYEQVLDVIKELEDVPLTPKAFEQLKNALEEIGCTRYDEWKKQKEENGKSVEENVVGKGIEQADISTAVSFVSKLLGDYSNANSSLSRMLDGGPEYGWVQQWLKKSREISQAKQSIPYYQVAKQVLMDRNGLPEEEAEKIVSTQTFDKIESQVYAKGSMDYVVEGIKLSLGLSDKEAEELSTFAYYGGKNKTIDLLRENNEMAHRLVSITNGQSIITNNSLTNELIMDTLFHVHDGWVQDNMKEFNAREKKHQHMPSELIGWKEAKADLLFVRPIFEAAGIEVNEEELEQVYNRRVKDFFLDRKIVTARNLSDSITQGEYFYPALANYGEVLTTINDPDYVDQNIIPAIEKNGIGKTEDVRRNIVAQIINNPTAKDIARLSESEKIQVEQTLTKRKKIAELGELAKEREGIKREIADIEGKIASKKKKDNIPSWDD